MKTTKIRKSAKGKDCTVRLPGVCSFNPKETVAGHRNGGGVAAKHHDIHSARICANCHRVVDGLPKSRSVCNLEDAMMLLFFYEGIFETQLDLIGEGLILVKK